MGGFAWRGPLVQGAWWQSRLETQSLQTRCATHSAGSAEVIPSYCDPNKAERVFLDCYGLAAAGREASVTVVVQIVPHLEMSHRKLPPPPPPHPAARTFTPSTLQGDENGSRGKIHPGGRFSVGDDFVYFTGIGRICCEDRYRLQHTPVLTVSKTRGVKFTCMLV